MKHVIKEMFGELTPFGKFWLYIGLATLGAAAAMSFDFGWTVSWKHALFLALLSIITAFAPEAAYRQFTEGRKGAASAIAVVCAPLFLIEFYSHAGYTAGQRGVNMGEARVQNATYTGSQRAVSEDEAALEREQSTLDQLKVAHPWAVTVTADALRAQLPPIEAALAREARNCGRRGCTTPDAGKGPEWQNLAKQKADIEGRIAIAEQRNGIAIRISDLEKRLANRRSTAAATEFKHSSVDYMNGFLAKAVALVGGQDEASPRLEKKADLSANVAMALAGTGLPGLAIFIAGLYRTRRSSDFTPGRTEASEPAPTPIQPDGYASPAVAMPPVYPAQARTPSRQMVVKATTSTIADIRRRIQAAGAQHSYGTA